jgi:hypothetical protein
MTLFCVQREGAAHLRDRLTLRLLRNQHTAATAHQLMVFTATVRHSIVQAYGGNSTGLRNGVMHAPVASEIPLAAFSKGACAVLRLSCG